MRTLKRVWYVVDDWVIGICTVVGAFYLMIYHPPWLIGIVLTLTAAFFLLVLGLAGYDGAKKRWKEAKKLYPEA